MTVWSNMDELVDSDEYSESEQQSLQEQVVKNPSKFTMSYEQFQQKNKDAEVEALKEEQQEQHQQALAQAKEQEADKRRMNMIEDFYAQKEKKMVQQVDPAHKYVQTVAAAQAPQANERNQQMLFQ